MSRTRFMELRRGLHVRQPSKAITSRELALVVTGSEDEPLPEWAADEDFEAELEGLIADHSVVWICDACDLIVGFVDVDREDVAGALLVAKSEGRLQCPRCEDGTVGWWEPEVLTLGEPIGIPESVQTEHPLAPEPPPRQDLTANDQFLEAVIGGKYDAMGSRIDVLTVSPQTYERFHSKLAETPAAVLGPVDVSAVKSISFRPGSRSGAVDLLGAHWERAMAIVGPGYPGLVEVAAGVAPGTGIAASAHRGPEGELAVVVETGLFVMLPTLANWLSRLFDGDVGKMRSRKAMAAIDELTGHVVRYLTDGGDTPLLDYRSREDVMRARFIADAQICFALLHELGHVVDWAEPAHDPACDDPDPRGRAIETEARADAWAIGRILENGEDWFLPWMQYRSVFWLFEYWWLMSAGLGDPRPTYLDPRQRWDRIEKLIGRQGRRPVLRSAYREELRMIFDLISDRLVEERQS